VAILAPWRFSLFIPFFSFADLLERCGCGPGSDSGEAGAPEGGAPRTIDASTGSIEDAGLDSNAHAMAPSDVDASIPTNVDAIAPLEVDATDSMRVEAGAEATALEPGVDAMGCGARLDSGAGDCGAPKPVVCDFFSCSTGCCDPNGVWSPRSFGS
jgi:hypothetical protein